MAAKPATGIVRLSPPAAVETVIGLADLHGRSFPRGWDKIVFKTLLDDPLTVCFVARAGEVPATAPPAHQPDASIVGAIVARHLLDEAEILTLAVDPVMRRQGIAAGLLAALTAAMAERAPVRLLLEVGVGNEPARALYAAFGFRELARRKGYYSAPTGAAEDALVMAFDIARPRADSV